MNYKAKIMKKADENTYIHWKEDGKAMNSLLASPIMSRKATHPDISYYNVPAPEYVGAQEKLRNAIYEFEDLIRKHNGF